MNKLRKSVFCVLLCMMTLLTGCTYMDQDMSASLQEKQTEQTDTNQSDINQTDTGKKNTENKKDTPYVIVNENVPEFTAEEITTESFEQYAPLDELDRCGAALDRKSTRLNSSH